jgi:hypothetical protein
MDLDRQLFTGIHGALMASPDGVGIGWPMDKGALYHGRAFLKPLT